MELDHQFLGLGVQPRDRTIHVLDGLLNLCVGRCVCGALLECFTVPLVSTHRETGFFFAPYGLEDKVVRRAHSDGVQAIFLVPVNRRAPFFQALQQHAAAALEVAADRDGIIGNTQGQAHVVCSRLWGS